MQRRVRLPESADMTKIKAQYINGTLTLEIPKAEVCSQLIPRRCCKSTCTCCKVVAAIRYSGLLAGIECLCRMCWLCKDQHTFPVSGFFGLMWISAGSCLEGICSL